MIYLFLEICITIPTISEKMDDYIIYRCIYLSPDSPILVYSPTNAFKDMLYVNELPSASPMA